MDQMNCGDDGANRRRDDMSTSTTIDCSADPSSSNHRIDDLDFGLRNLYFVQLDCIFICPEPFIFVSTYQCSSENHHSGHKADHHIFQQGKRTQKSQGDPHQWEYGTSHQNIYRIWVIIWRLNVNCFDSVCNLSSTFGAYWSGSLELWSFEG